MNAYQEPVREELATKEKARVATRVVILLWLIASLLVFAFGFWLVAQLVSMGWTATD